MTRISRQTPQDPAAERGDSTTNAIEALALEKDAEVVGGALIGGGVNWGMYTEEGFVPSAEGLAVKAALDAEAAKKRSAE